MYVRYDGTLVGCAVYTFIDLNSDTPADINNAGLFYAFLLAGVSGLVHSAVATSSKLPALTAAFNIVMIFFLSAIGRGTSKTAQLKWSTPFSETSITNTTMAEEEDEEEDDEGEGNTSMSGVRLWRATILGVGQFIFINSDVGAVLVITAILICSRKAAGMAVLGSITGTLVSLYVVDVPSGGADGALWTGLYSYNCMGTAVAIGGGRYLPAWRVCSFISV